MNTISYAKYTANGNNFVILDEIRQEQIPETKKSQFSKMICNESTGIGCDTLIIIQRYNQDSLHKIYGTSKKLSPSSKNTPQFIMRVFERDGSESYNCGNGLICLGHHLNRTYRVEKADIATEIPSANPFFRSVKSINNTIFQATLGHPTLPSHNFVTPLAIQSVTQYGTAYRLKKIPIAIPFENIDEKTNFAECYATFTGEPHIVIFDPSLFNESKRKHVLDTLFINLFNPSKNSNSLLQSQHAIQQIGLQFNALKDHFPQGININFAKLLDNGKIAYRCFERGVNSETFACGTGATAVASIAKELSLVENSEISILPWRARHEQSYQDAEIMVKIENQQYDLLTQSTLLAEGTYYL